MTPSPSKSLAAICVFLCVAAQARGQPRFGSITSLESTVAQAEVIVVGTIVEFDKDKRLAAIAVEETLKGKSRERFEVQLTNRDTLIAHWKAQSSRLLVTTMDAQPIAKVLDLTMGELEVMTADFTILRNAKDAIRVVKETAPSAGR